MTTEHPLQALDGVVGAHIIATAEEVSRRLTALGVPHALIGGLAVGIHGHPRATKDVDFLVGKEAFAQVFPIMVYRDELSEVVRIGVVDLLAVPSNRPELRLALALPAPGELPVIPVEALVLMKLDAHRPQDRADVVALLRSGADLAEVRAFLAAEAPDLLPRFGSLVAELFSA